MLCTTCARDIRNLAAPSSHAAYIGMPDRLRNRYHFRK
jgi:hypothetical protein